MPIQFVSFKKGQCIGYACRIIVVQPRVHREQLPSFVCRAQTKKACRLRVGWRVETTNQFVESNTSTVHVMVRRQREYRYHRLSTQHQVDKVGEMHLALH